MNQIENQLSKHSPGPWIANGNQIEAKSRLCTIICTTACKANGVQYAARDLDEARANALLIAAAPELLEALKDLLKHSEKVNYAYYVENRSKALMTAMQGQKELLQNARTAIAKAIGRAA